MSHSLLQLDHDGDVVMAEASSPISPLRRLNFDWFRLEGDSRTSQQMNTSQQADAKHSNSDTPSSEPSSNVSDAHERTSHLRIINPSQLLILPKPPGKPLNWVWQCHLCRSRYPLSVTRRCLVDGHYYCSGDNSQRNVKRRKKTQSCTSEFDYLGWQEWGQWRRKCLALQTYVDKTEAPIFEGCEGCAFPSQCRYENRPARETLNLKALVTAEDLKTLKFDESEPSRSSDQATDGKSDLTDSEKENLFVARKVKKLVDLEAAGEKKSGASLAARASAGARFYKGITQDKTLALPPVPEEDHSTRGLFDPSLPSLQASSFDKQSSRGSTDHENAEQILVDTLKAALNERRPAASSPVTRSRSRVSDTEQPRLEQRVNDNDKHRTSTAGSSSQEVGLASKTTTERVGRRPDAQSLLSSWFNSTKGTSGHRENSKEAEAENPVHSTNEEEILSFLRLASTPRPSKKDKSVTPSARSLETALNTSHFEDINISPVEIASRSKASSVEAPASPNGSSGSTSTTGSSMVANSILSGLGFRRR